LGKSAAAWLVIGVVAVPCAATCAELLPQAPPAAEGGVFDVQERPALDAPLPDRAFQPLAGDGFAGDGRRTMGAFPKNVARSFVGVFSRSNASALLLGGGLAAAGHAFDGQAERALMGQCTRCGSTGATMGGAPIVPVVGALFLAGRFAPQGAFRSVTYDMGQALVVNAAWTGVFKYGLHRTRPDASDNLSFPSGHTSSAFSLATVAERHYGWKVGVPAYVLASGIGLSRIESNRHHLSDVLAGATLGVIVGRTVTRLNGEPAPRKRTLALGPATDLNGGGVGLGVSATW
jgi:membrane-associated phospholipid phosphatase